MSFKTYMNFITASCSGVPLGPLTCLNRAHNLLYASVGEGYMVR